MNSRIASGVIEVVQSLLRVAVCWFGSSESRETCPYTTHVNHQEIT